MLAGKQEVERSALLPAPARIPITNFQQSEDLTRVAVGVGDENPSEMSNYGVVRSG
jgi:hypothetical protein